MLHAELQRQMSACIDVVLQLVTSDASICRKKLYRFDVDKSNRIVTAASISSRSFFTVRLHVMQRKVCPYVRPSVKRVHCDKTNESFAFILERMFIVVFRHEKCT